MRIFRFILCASLCFILVFSLYSCSGGEKKRVPSDSELTAKAAELVEKSNVLMDLFFVYGIEPETDSPKIESGYIEADSGKLSEHGFASYEDIKTYAKSIFTAELFYSFESIAVNPLFDGTSLYERGYCYDAKDDSGNFICLMVSVEGVHRETDITDYDFSTLTVKQKTSQKATLTVNVKITDKNNPEKHQTKTKTLYLTYQSGQWLLDSLTCIAYYEN